MFGKVYGLMICFAGALNLLQTALDVATHKVFHGDPIPVSVTLLTIVLLVGSTLSDTKAGHRIESVLRKRPRLLRRC